MVLHIPEVPGGGFAFVDRQQHRFATLDAMRGVAAISVMLFHYLFFISSHLFSHAFYAVDFFFCLSGVILTHSYENRIIKGMRFAQYMERRLIRFYPFYLLGFSLGAILFLIYMIDGSVIGFWTKDYMLSVFLGAFFLPYPNHGALPFVGDQTFSGALFPIDVPSWSLFFEILASAALFVVVRKQIKPGYVVIVSFVLLIGAIWHYKTPNVGWGIDTFFGGFPRTAFAFFVGVMMYRFYVRLKPFKFRLNPWLLLAITGLVFALPTGGIICVALMPGLIFMGLVGTNLESHVRVFEQLGRMSFGIYVIHWPVYHLLVVTLNESVWGSRLATAPILLAGVASIIVIAVAYLLTSFIDEPVRRWLGTRLAVRESRVLAT